MEIKKKREKSYNFLLIKLFNEYKLTKIIGKKMKRKKREKCGSVGCTTGNSVKKKKKQKRENRDEEL